MTRERAWEIALLHPGPAPEPEPAFPVTEEMVERASLLAQLVAQGYTAVDIREQLGLSVAQEKYARATAIKLGFMRATRGPRRG